MRFGVLGALEVFDDEGTALEIGSEKQRIFLAALLAAPGQVVSDDRLLYALWGGDPPASAVQNIRVYAHRLRRRIGEARIVYRQGGYAVLVRAGELDVERFEQEAAEGARLLATGDSEGAAAAYGRALGLWRGDPFDGLDHERLQIEAARLHELRLVVLEHRIDAELALGRERRIVAELTGLVTRFPLRERFRAQLMLALYRAGRAAEALEVFREGRTVLVEELGIEPSVSLRELEHAILTRDPALDPPDRTREPGPGEPSTTPPGVPVPSQLPPLNSFFTGRSAELEEILAVLGRASGLVAISGPGGAGKSALAVQAANAIVDAYPDGQLYVDLHGATPGMEPLTPIEVLGRFLRALGAGGAQIPTDVEEAAATFRSLASGRRLLIVLDDAADVAQVRPLLPGTGSGSSVIVVGRRVLAGLDGAWHVHLRALPQDEAIEMLGETSGREQIAAERETAAELVRLCGSLPLAVRIAGARLAARPDWTVGNLVRKLGDERARLDELAHGDLEVRSSCAISHRGLPEQEVRLFELLGLLHQPDFTVPVAAALTGWSEADARRGLDRLVDAQLVEARPDDRFVLHDLLRLYAAEQAEANIDEQQRRDAVQRVLHFYLATARTALRVSATLFQRRAAVGPPDDTLTAEGLALTDREAVAAWLLPEADNIVTVVRQAAGFDPVEGPAIAVGISAALMLQAYRQGLRGLHIRMGEVTRQAAGATGVLVWEARALADLGVAYADNARPTEALPVLEQALRLWQDADDEIGQLQTLNMLGLAYDEAEQLERAVQCFQLSIDICRRRGDRSDELVAMNNLAEAQSRLGDHEQAIATHQRVLAIKRAEDGPNLGMTLGNLGDLYGKVGRPADAVAMLEEAIEALHRDGYRKAESVSTWTLASALHDLGRHGEARHYWRAALDIQVQLNTLTVEQAEAVMADPVPTTPSLLKNG